jgi:hypothetical protein
METVASALGVACFGSLESEGQITQRERISTSVEVPLTKECKKALQLAAEASERLAQQYIGTQHLFLGTVKGGRLARC